LPTMSAISAKPVTVTVTALLFTLGTLLTATVNVLLGYVPEHPAQLLAAPESTRCPWRCRAPAHPRLRALGCRIPGAHAPGRSIAAAARALLRKCGRKIHRPCPIALPPDRNPPVAGTRHRADAARCCGCARAPGYRNDSAAMAHWDRTRQKRGDCRAEDWAGRCVCRAATPDSSVAADRSRRRQAYRR